jgi:hypothetical protein
MAANAVLKSNALVNGVGGDDNPFVRKKLRVSDLPITATQRSTIDSLLHTFTKKGEFDKLRKSIFAKFEQSVSHTSHYLSVQLLTIKLLGREDEAH